MAVTPADFCAMQADLAAQRAAKELPLIDSASVTGGGADEYRPFVPELKAPLITRRELAGRLDVHMETVSKWERAGMPVAEVGRRGRPSRYREPEVRAWLERRWASRPQAQLDLLQERARKERWQALLAEQTYRDRERHLLPAVEVDRVWAAHVEDVRAVILRRYSEAAAPRLVRAAEDGGVFGVEHELKMLAYEVLTELSESA